MNKYEIPLEPDRFYHIYNRGNNSERIFFTPENYKFFLHRFDEYLSPFVDVYAFCLLPNHFHFLVQVKDATSDLPGFKNLAGLSPLISKAFSNFFNSYSKAINKQQDRHGSLFEKPFKRKLITDTKYLSNVVFYIHANSQLHGITDDFRMYPWSSYNRILSNSPTRLQKESVRRWFDTPENYVSYHNQKMDIAVIKEMILDD